MSEVSNLIGIGVGSEKASILGQASLANGRPIDLDIGKTATGSTITDAYQIIKTYTLFTTVAASTGAKLSLVADPGVGIIIKNRGANALTVYPANASGIISGSSLGSAGTGVSQAAGTTVTYRRTGTNTWEY